MASKPLSTIPAFYRHYFSTLDPLVCLWAVYMDLFTPSTVISAFVPAAIAPRNPYFDFLVQQLGGALFMLGFLDVVLLRYTDDVGVWRILEAAVLSYDLSLLGSVWFALGQQGRLSWGALRWEDWGGIAITGQAVVVRSAFLLGLGMAGKSKGWKKA